MPYHVDIDYHLTNYQNDLAAGSTRSGIAPVYADKLYRHGLRVTDLLNKEIFEKRLRKSFDFNKSLITLLILCLVIFSLYINSPRLIPGLLSIKFKALRCAGPKNFFDNTSFGSE